MVQPSKRSLRQSSATPPPKRASTRLSGKSPKKLQRISLDALKRSTTTRKLKKIGAIYKLSVRGTGGFRLVLGGRKRTATESEAVAEDEEDKIIEVEESDEEHTRTVKKGTLDKVVLRCVVVDNRVGRLPSGGKGKSGYRFVNIADVTGMISIYVHARDTGFKLFDLKENDCSENARCFFNA